MEQHLLTITKPETKTSSFRLSAEELKQFEELGYLGPYDLFSAEEAGRVFDKCFEYPRLFLPWKKGRHVVVKEMANTAMAPEIIDRATSILGKDVLLWGSMIIRQKPAGKHPLHVDIEHAAWHGITIWIAMQNVESGKSFSIIPGSHHFNTSPQEICEHHNIAPGDDAAVLKAARKIKPDSELVHLNVSDGQFIIFSGRLWHGTKNDTALQRSSMIFQYTRPDSKVKVAKTFKMPGNEWYKKTPPCILVHGKDNYKVNKLKDAKQINTKMSYLKGLFFYLPLNLLEMLTS